MSLTGKKNVYQLNYFSFLMPQIEEIRCIFIVKRRRQSRISHERKGQLIELRATVMAISFKEDKTLDTRGGERRGDFNLKKLI